MIDYPLREREILTLIEQYGWIDGAHHKQWVLTEIAKIILGDEYQAWARSEDPEMYGDWDEGIAP
jgi:hypothetical protein